MVARGGRARRGRRCVADHRWCTVGVRRGHRRLGPLHLLTRLSLLGSGPRCRLPETSRADLSARSHGAVSRVVDRSNSAQLARATSIIRAPSASRPGHAECGAEQKSRFRHEVNQHEPVSATAQSTPHPRAGGTVDRHGRNCVRIGSRSGGAHRFSRRSGDLSAYRVQRCRVGGPVQVNPASEPPPPAASLVTGSRSTRHPDYRTNLAGHGTNHISRVQQHRPSWGFR